MSLELFAELPTGETVPVSVDMMATVADLRQQLKEVDPKYAQCKISFAGEGLTDDDGVLADLGLCPEARFQVVHGRFTFATTHGDAEPRGRTSIGGISPKWMTLDESRTLAKHPGNRDGDAAAELTPMVHVAGDSTVRLQLPETAGYTHLVYVRDSTWKVLDSVQLNDSSHGPATVTVKSGTLSVTLASGEELSTSLREGGEPDRVLGVYVFNAESAVAIL
eukprot:TRINITY_DN1240_c0_g1_i3.p1 TRINITY_DN1240_c0_g1~~TRINITY_DN1240_c0_g1_i3.p1  ORF type:complete len:221 (+),score=46.09 TRINITY_DN1240_c0_g1_i3:3-665(+)